ncbi:hypothetical protein AVEN_264917-1 [Araneus ventricosus]|uniref:Uncharacterized protein n=1 Tax=Araneus ventricosus TaxID=182803 RepID=A0A4Y2GZN8_ARAVE|nr:hypothetical protein AVEN_264917-1 [Araneus ventricosus]
MGKTNEIEERDSTNTVLSCHVNDAIISDLWRLDTLGICDPSEKKTREEVEQSAKEHFFRNVTRNQEGRYQIRLLCVEGPPPPLTNCKVISEKRLVNCIKSLKKLGKIEEYETIKDWLDQSIEEVDSSEPEHDLAHRFCGGTTGRKNSLKWKLKNDTVSVDLRDLVPFAEDQPVTKRIILSPVHNIFDPIGLTCPATLTPKLMLQECWKLKLSWGTDLPSSMARKFVKWKEQLKFLNDISIPRCLDKNEGDRNITFHVFCDASEKTYAACIFLRREGDDSTDCQLIQARVRVDPLKSISMFRLELLACNIGARMCQSVKDSLGMEEVATRYWSDSSNALY